MDMCLSELFLKYELDIKLMTSRGYDSSLEHLAKNVVYKIFMSSWNVFTSFARKPIFCWYYTQAVRVALGLRSFCSKCPFPPYHSLALAHEVPEPFPFPDCRATMKGHQIRKFQISPGVCFPSLLLCQCAEHVSVEARNCLFSNRSSPRNFILQLAVRQSYHPSTYKAKEYMEGVQELLGQPGSIASKCLKNNQTKEIQKKEISRWKPVFRWTFTKYREMNHLTSREKNYSLSLSLPQWNKASYFMMVDHVKALEKVFSYKNLYRERWLKHTHTDPRPQEQWRAHTKQETTGGERHCASLEKMRF